MCVFVFLTLPSVSLPVTDQMPFRRGVPAGVCTPAWARWSMEPIISQAGPGRTQPSSGPAQAQDSLVTPRINDLEACQPAGVARERGQDRQRRRMT